ncbi:MAG: DegQ family serine endoprotease [Candidatus Marinimicrobia bacterium]|nr:DegQ family serine endoprotease [Candidatus Neomarinimicrobiota bacterium]MCF7830072.1 DegQ family serine endoprotease [Candidatus Neomarinimicrobiota bacterium]MCF7882119.1 DegQ family serine endoprotease [Candidatus Neomarinimicrobiota bacterium]
MRKTLSRIFLGISLFSVGFIVALILLSDFEWTQQGQAAGPEPVMNVSKSESELDSDSQNAVLSLNKAFVDIAEKTTKSVVTIRTTKVVEHPQLKNSPFEEFFDRFGPREEFRTRALGSGVIVSDDGYILTNHHVISQGEEIMVKLKDGREFQAEEVKSDPMTDIAVVKIDADDLPAIQIGNSEELKVGEWVLAIGSPFSEQLQHTVTAGIVSAKGRTDVMRRRNRDLYEDFIQTDAAINPGNSGGALVNLYGQLVGINTAIATRSGGNQGVGFAIPINMATRIMNDLIERGRVVRAWLGVRIQDVDSDIAKSMDMDRPNGAAVLEIVEDSPAANADLQVGDVITAVDGKQIRNSSDLRTRIASREPDTKHKLTIIREGNEKTVTVELGELPENLASRSEAPEEDEISDFGMTLQNITPQMAQRFELSVDVGVLVTEVERGSPAAEKNIRPGHVITHVGLNNPIENVEEYRQSISEYEPGESVLLVVQAGDNSFFAGFTIPEE